MGSIFYANVISYSIHMWSSSALPHKKNISLEYDWPFIELLYGRIGPMWLALPNEVFSVLVIADFA
jgi:hypothetical protein